MPEATVVDVAGASHMIAGDRNDAFSDAVVTFLRDEVLPTVDHQDGLGHVVAPPSIPGGTS
jgi:hypothetical protein